jgi:(4-(4-[2-(gamma-L-glutamylamino)ethyl]phenoxymethyl)furan-2-yl)methanamine synthase
MAEDLVTGWDLGGAHLKAAQVERGGRLVTALQVPCRLWLGMDELTHSLGEARRQLRRSRRHGVTMTGELADLFADRAEGVARLSQAMAETLAGDDLRVYAGQLGFVASPGEHWQAVASANWHASARFVATRCPQALFIDIGSTTADIVPLRDGRVEAVGYTDDERLGSEELVYTGATRTPVMAVADSVPFGGRRQRLMAEHFATMADVHRLTGELPDDADQLPTADGRGKTAEESGRRLARMLGRDLQSAELADWRRLAAHLAERQRQTLHAAIDRVLSRGALGDEAPVVGAGVGRFLLRPLAGRLRRPYVDFASLVEGEPATREWAARCAPAAAVAILAADGW